VSVIQTGPFIIAAPVWG